MVVTKFFAKFRAVTGSLAVAGMLVAAHPALANSSAAAVDIAVPLRAAQAANPSVAGAEDEQFKQLFNSWQKFEDTGFIASRKTAPDAIGTRRLPTSVSIPSVMPIRGEVLTSGYGMRVHPVLGGMRAHKGVDLAAPVGTPVFAPADGVVSRASWFSSYGLFISLEHGADLQTRYGHLSRVNVAEGQAVHKGDLIGYVGTTGRSTGPHLHYEVRVDGVAVNPAPYMQSSLAAVESGDAKGG
ncbi:M23 family metallopeptidase [Novosphingobium colocasiae]|uniref:M23 family metallopeptidase n=1 Tax=Novosphingobium colocasiae TaxID=1256513 RepID=UPI0035B3CE9F